MFKDDEISYAFDVELKKFLEKINPLEIPDNLTSFYYTNIKIENDKIKKIHMDIAASIQKVLEEIDELIEEERDKVNEHYNPLKASQTEERGEAFHEKKEKNKKTNQGGSYRRTISKKYKKPKTRGDKNYNKRNKKKKR